MPTSNRRDEILDSAQAVFTERGVRAATIDEITSEAGVAKGTFYLYFDSKDAVLQALRERLGAELLAEVESALRKKSRQQALSEFIAVMANFRSRNPAAATLVAHRPEGLPAADSEKAVTAALARFLSEGSKVGEFDIKDPQSLATLLHATLRATFEDPLTASDSTRLRSAAEDLFRTAVTRKHKKK